MQHGHDLGIESAVQMAEVIHDDLTIGGVVSWQWWLAVASGGYKDGLIYAHPKTQKIEPAKRLWAMGQYSRFVRPGFVRVAVDAGDVERLKVTAFASTDGRRLACVMINPTDKPIAAVIAAPGFAARSSSLYVTDEARDLAAVKQEGGDVILPALSVSTLLLDQ